MKKIKIFFFQILYRPFFIIFLSLLFLLVNLILDGTLLHIFNLNRDLRVIENRIDYIGKKNKDLKEKIKRTSDPDFVEQEARERLDYVGEEELIFIFPDNL